MLVDLRQVRAFLRQLRSGLPLVLLFAPLLFIYGLIFGRESLPWVVAGISLIFGGFTTHYGLNGGLWICDGTGRNPECADHRDDRRRHIHAGEKLVPLLVCLFAFLGSAWLATFSLTTGFWPWEASD